MNNFINNQAFKEIVTSLNSNDTILIRNTNDSKKNTEISVSNFVTELANSYPYLYKTTNYTITNSDRKIECLGNFIVTLPLLSSITHYDNITINAVMNYIQ